ncbi:hypothetical protein Pint_25164 [Pistacia integerrima]|uniref:Uncharacterized protein n=1 Tax=Pistacia integerrima TaxID=434235 RepID=A0ACC0YDF4_9ROSI|nr:hypothetical protein Pint_25164 [Pistacia integerrima]
MDVVLGNGSFVNVKNLSAVNQDQQAPRPIALESRSTGLESFREHTRSRGVHRPHSRKDGISTFGQTGEEESDSTGDQSLENQPLSKKKPKVGRAMPVPASRNLEEHIAVVEDPISVSPSKFWAAFSKCDLSPVVPMLLVLMESRLKPLSPLLLEPLLLIRELLHLLDVKFRCSALDSTVPIPLLLQVISPKVVVEWQKEKNIVMRLWKTYSIFEVMMDDKGTGLSCCNGGILWYWQAVSLDRITEDTCIHGAGRIGFAHVLIEVDTARKLLEMVCVHLPLEDSNDPLSMDVRVEYQWRPSQCDKCQVFGHSVSSCPL